MFHTVEDLSSQISAKKLIIRYFSGYCNHLTIGRYELADDNIWVALTYFDTQLDSNITNNGGPISLINGQDCPSSRAIMLIFPLKKKLLKETSQKNLLT